VNIQLVIQFPLAGATAEEFDRLLMIENEFGLVLRNGHQVDGHDIGYEEMNIFIHTNDPYEAFDLVKNTLSENNLSNIVAAFREIKGDDYTVIWPVNHTEEFIVK